MMIVNPPASKELESSMRTVSVLLTIMIVLQLFATGTLIYFLVVMNRS
jgi:hypothetical protein